MTITDIKWLTTFLFFLLPISAQANNASPDFSDGFQRWKQAFIHASPQFGLPQTWVFDTLESITPDPRVIILDRKQPEKKASFATYYNRMVTSRMINLGRAKITTLGHYKATGMNALSDLGIMTALWGMESRYGQNMGDFSVIRSLATLAYEGRRADFFTKELITALQITYQQGWAAEALTGSWAGAFGQCQFMPSTYALHARDGDADNVIDIWNNDADIVASIGNYLQEEGWVPGEAWGQEVRLQATKPVPIGLDTTHPISVWKEMGVSPITGSWRGHERQMASVIQPDGQGGRAFVVYDNFRALMKWNRSVSFALTAGLVADRLTQ